MHRVHTAPALGWLIALTATIGVWLLAASPSWLSPAAGYGVREAFSLLCHQLADRSPHVHGAQWALCHRCTGLLGGVVLGLAAGPWLARPFARIADAWGTARTMLIFALPTTIDWGLGAMGIWANVPASRIITGAVLGLAAGWLLADALLTRPSHNLSTHPTT